LFASVVKVCVKAQLRIFGLTIFESLSFQVLPLTHHEALVVQ
jgi:hypothetical protein